GEMTEKQERYVDNIRSSGRHLFGMIEDMLDLAQMEAGGGDLRIISFCLKDVLAGALSRFGEKAATRGITLELHVEREAEKNIRTDPAKLKQILHNLLSNAVKFTPKGGAVHVAARMIRSPLEDSADLTGLLEICVADTGIGIKADDIPRLFQGFTQLESPYSKTYGGVGLGLALTKKLVESLNGAVYVESEVGRGSRFTFVIPVGRVPWEQSPVPVHTGGPDGKKDSRC
ncbi:MAG TPA: ATP-binding protein, partial [Geobacteraceae bacterium]